MSNPRISDVDIPKQNFGVGLGCHSRFPAVISRFPGELATSLNVGFDTVTTSQASQIMSLKEDSVKLIVFIFGLHNTALHMPLRRNNVIPLNNKRTSQISWEIC